MWGGKKAREVQKQQDSRYRQSSSNSGGGAFIGTIDDCLRAIADRVSGYTGRFWRYDASVGYHSITVTVHTGGQDHSNYWSDIKYDIDNAVRKAAREVGCSFEFDYDIEIDEY